MARFGRPRWAKIGMLGFPKSGKTYTAISMACGLHKLLGSQRPLRVFDSEGGIEFQLARITELIGQEPDGEQSQSFVDLVKFVGDCREGDIVIVDSVTHPWRELLDACQDKQGRFRGIMAAKKDWQDQFTAWYLTSPCHVIICGRAGYEFDYVEDPKTGEKELTKTATKMKTESELGFEPSLLIEMLREEKADHTLNRVAVVKGDRFGLIDARRYANPTFETFKPWFDLLDLQSGGAPNLDVSAKTINTLDGNGRGRIHAERTEREVILSEIKDDLVSAFPGQSAAEKKVKVDLIRECFMGDGWARLETNWKQWNPTLLRAGREKLAKRIAELQEVAA